MVLGAGLQFGFELDVSILRDTRRNLFHRLV
ncbi:hypothetical protein NB231_11319 [Nitrococcus mobilis Nb-231]|uniref:Uncharacterized protein n=1 Tax=Nitrococcus mobilis Nb-231 TaxID=314278 RepID=A4BP21_9GAMM|nr:hypothetical protein NB231_11319 [Nitrococcus mobilis Nb-231]